MKIAECGEGVTLPDLLNGLLIRRTIERTDDTGGRMFSGLSTCARGGPCRGGFAVSAMRRIRAFLPPGFKGFAYKLRSYSRDPVRVLTKPVLNVYFHSCFCITDLLAL